MVRVMEKEGNGGKNPLSVDGVTRRGNTINYGT